MIVTNWFVLITAFLLYGGSVYEAFVSGDIRQAIVFAAFATANTALSVGVR